MFAKTACILISGKINSGKSTLAKYMNEYAKSLNYLSQIGSFAVILKQIASAVFKWDGLKDEKGRKLLQEIGMAGRNYNENIWADYLSDGIPVGIDFLIIDDWRFENERKVFENRISMKVYTVQILSPNAIDNRHESEHSLPVSDRDYYDFLVNNDATLDELNTMAKEIIDIVISNHPKY